MLLLIDTDNKYIEVDEKVSKAKLFKTLQEVVLGFKNFDIEFVGPKVIDLDQLGEFLEGILAIEFDDDKQPDKPKDSPKPKESSMDSFLK